MLRNIKLIIMFVILVLTSCKTPKPKPKPVEPPKKSFPAISWKRAVDSKVFIVGESSKRIFGVEFDDKNMPVNISAFNKNSGRKKWSKDIELGLKIKNDPNSFSVKIKGATIAFWTKDNKISTVDKYRGVKLWDKDVDGFGLSILGENFITAYDTKIRLIDPETGKFTDLDMKRKITSPIHVTPKGYIVVITGDTASLVDLENEKITKKWVWNINMDKGFEIDSVYSSDDSVIFFQRTHKKENQLWVSSINGDSLKYNWKVKFKATESKPRTFVKFFKTPKARIVLNPETSTEKQWKIIDLKTGKSYGKTIYSKLDPPKNCIFSEKITYCAFENGIKAFDSATWKKLWFRETIYPIEDNEHKIINNNMVLAAGNRVKIFAPNGSSPLAFDLKSKTIKEPKVSKIIGGLGNLIFFTVADLTPNKRTGKTKGEIWALDTNKKRIKWRVPVGEANTLFNSIDYVPKANRIFAANHLKVISIDVKTGETFIRYHKIKTSRKAKVSIGHKGKTGWVVLPDAVQFFNIRKLGFRFSTKFSLSKKIKNEKPKGKPLLKKYSFIGFSHKMVLIKDLGSNSEITAYSLENNKKIWTIKFNSILEPTLYSTKSSIVLSSFGKTTIFNPENGKLIQTIKGSKRAFICNGNLIVVRQIISKPEYGSRIFVFKYKSKKGLIPDLAWQKVFSKPKEKPLKGFNSKYPQWISSGTEYIFVPVKGGRCLNIFTSIDGEKIFEFCKGVWPQPPLVYKGKFYNATGELIDGIPAKEQGIISFTLDKKWKLLLKMSKYGNPKYFYHQLHPIKKGTIFLQGTGETLQAVKIAD